MSNPWDRERGEVEPGRLVMPFYLVCDVSYSMQPDMPALNEGVQRLRRAIVAEPVVDDVAQISILTFSDTSRVVLPLAQMSEVSPPVLAPEGGTNYGSAFVALRAAIESDTAELKRQGYKVYRPCAFFLTDGEPLDDDWLKTFGTTLTYNRQTGAGMRSHPIFVPFGFGAAREDVLKKLAYPPERGKWYSAQSSSVEDALKGILDIIMNTVVTSAQSSASGKPIMAQQPPPPGSGIKQGDSEYHEDYV